MKIKLLSKSSKRPLTNEQIMAATAIAGLPLIVVVIFAVTFSILLDDALISILHDAYIVWNSFFLFAVGELLCASLVLGGEYLLNRVIPPEGPRSRARIVIQILGAVFAALISMSLEIGFVIWVWMAVVFLSGMPTTTLGMF